MGSTVSHVKEEAAKVNDQNEKMANDALNALVAMATQKLEAFDLELTSSTALTFPIDHIVHKYSNITCGVDQNATGFKDGVSKTIGHFANGRFLEGILSAFTTTVDATLGSYAGNQSEKKQYLVSVGQLGGFYRVDYLVYSYEFTSDELIKITKNVLCCALCISTIKTDTLTPNDVRVLLESGFESSSAEQLKAMEQEIFSILWPNEHPQPPHGAALSTDVHTTRAAGVDYSISPGSLNLSIDHGSQDDEKMSAILRDVKMFRIDLEGSNVHLTPLQIEAGLNRAMLNPACAYLLSDPLEGDVFVWVGGGAPANMSKLASRIGSSYTTNKMNSANHVSVYVIHENSGAQYPVFDRLFEQHGGI